VADTKFYDELGQLLPEYKKLAYYKDELDRTGVFFPGRPAYQTVRDIKLSAEKKCPKDAKQPGKFGSGTLLFWCAQHRCCIGFVILQSAESVQHVYTAMVTRFRVMPKVIKLFIKGHYL
jgi:hypothetical protein